MASQAVKCTVGDILGSECHKTTVVKQVGEKNILSDLSHDDIEILLLRSGIGFEQLKDQSTICYHHESYIKSSLYIQDKFCCDPFERHTRNCQGKETWRKLSTIQLIILSSYMSYRSTGNNSFTLQKRQHISKIGSWKTTLSSLYRSSFKGLPE